LAAATAAACVDLRTDLCVKVGGAHATAQFPAMIVIGELLSNYATR
jgi:hypothetical protein